VLSKLKDATTRGHFGDDLDTFANPAVVRNHIETLKDQVRRVFRCCKNATIRIISSRKRF
jgi:hypothetical protein